MRLQRAWRASRGYTRVLITPLLILSRIRIIDVGECLQRVHNDQIRSTNARVGQVGTKTPLENVENGIVCGIYGGLLCGGDEINEVARAHGGRHCRRHGLADMRKEEKERGKERAWSLVTRRWTGGKGKELFLRRVMPSLLGNPPVFFRVSHHNFTHKYPLRFIYIYIHIYNLMIEAGSPIGP